MYVRVKVTPNARQEYLKPDGRDRFLAAVSEPAKQNRANRRLIELVAAHFKIPSAKIRIINGHTTPTKLLSVPDGP